MYVADHSGSVPNANTSEASHTWGDSRKLGFFFFVQAVRTSGSIFFRTSFFTSFHKYGNCRVASAEHFCHFFWAAVTFSVRWQNSISSSTVVCFLAHAMLANTALTKIPMFTSAKNKTRMRVISLRPIVWQVCVTVFDLKANEICRDDHHFRRRY